MGLRGIMPLILILVIALILFGSRRLRDIGTDLGAAIRSFRKGLQDEQDEKKND